MLKKLTFIMTAVLLLIGGLPATSQAAEAAVSLHAIPDQYRGATVTVAGTTTLAELNMKVINSQGTLIYVNTFAPQADGTYSHQFKLSATEALGKTTVAIGEGSAVASTTFNIRQSEDSGNGGGVITPPDTSNPPVDTSEDIEVYVNGKAEQAGTAATAVVNGQSVTTVTVDPAKLEERLGAEGQRAVIAIQLNKPSDAVIGQLNGQMVSNMERKQAIIEIRAEQAAYSLPAQQINIESLSEQFGQNVELKDIMIQIGVSEPTPAAVKAAEQAGAAGGFAIVVPPVDFTIKAVYNGKTIEVGRFNAYVERTIAIPDGTDPEKLTTAIVVEPDGTVRHVPTQIVVIEGKYYAKVNSLTNSLYSVIWNPVSFKDMERHWAEHAVNDMGSRLIINGNGANQFQPDQAITRAEFAAIIVRGLGLKMESGAAPFADVKSSSWYNDVIHTAHAYKLISGYEDGTFRPTENITREQAMVIMSKAMALSGLKAKLEPQDAGKLMQAYADSGQVSGWAVSGVADSLQAGVVSGRSDDELAPSAQVSRAEVAVMVQRLLQKSGLI